MHRVCFSSVSIVGVLICDLIPLFLCLLFVNFHVAYILGPLLFLKGFLFGYTSGLIYFSYPGSGWLIRLLYSISQQGMAVLFPWFAFRRILFGNTRLRKDIILYISFGVFFAVADKFIAAPFLKDLLTST